MLTTRREKREKKKVQDVRGHGGAGCGIGNASEKGVVRGRRKSRGGRCGEKRKNRRVDKGRKKE